MEKYKCKLCFKSFVNGRALGGHMRSHMLNLYVPPKTGQLSDYTDSVYSYSSSSGGEEENEYNELVDADSVVLQDRESETESSKNPTRRRSKRVRKSRISETKLIQLGRSESYWVDPEPVSSISDTTPEEDVAYCLMMLSRDTWMREKQKDEDHSGESETEFRLSKTGRVRDKYRCETCSKVFRSYQALGGHRASHKKIKLSQPSSTHPHPETENVEEKIHQCPVCFRVFLSGQALGGHKRSHVTGSAKPVAKHVQTLIDLNLPAPIEDDDEISQIDDEAMNG